MAELKPCPFCGSKSLSLYKIREPLPDFEETEFDRYRSELSKNIFSRGVSLQKQKIV